MALILENITKYILLAAFELYRILGYGFLEKVYQKAMQVELSQNGLQAELEQPIKIHFKEPSLAITTLIRSSRGK